MLRVNIKKEERVHKKVIRLSQKTGLIMLTLLLICSSCSSTERKREDQPQSTSIPNQQFITSSPDTTQEVRSTEAEALETVGHNEPEVTNWSSPGYKARAFSILNKIMTEVTEYTCPTGCKAHLDGCDIKGNISYTSKEKIFHAPGQEYYTPTVITPMFGERWFCTEEDAIANGWRKSRK